MSYYDPNYWRRFGRNYPYTEPYPALYPYTESYPAPPMQPYRPADPLQQLGLGKRVVLAACPCCGTMTSADLQFCPQCGAQRF